MYVLFHVQVNYVGKAANLYQDAGYKLSGSAYVIEKHLGTSWLWDKVRQPGQVRQPRQLGRSKGTMMLMWTVPCIGMLTVTAAAMIP
jgi:hypothetical protein